MNRFITLMLLGVVGVAMLLVFFVHMGANDNPAPSSNVISHSPSPAPQPKPEAPAAPPAPPAEAAPPARAENAPQATPPAAPAQRPAPAPAPTPAPAPAAKPAPAPAPARATAEQKPRATASVPEGSGNILDISLHFKDDGLLLRIEGDGPLPAKYFILSQPERLVLDLPGAWKGLKRPDIPSNNLVKSARLGRQGNADRLVLDLAVPVKTHNLSRISDSKVELYFAP